MLHQRWSLLHINAFIKNVYKQLEIDNVSTVSSVAKDISCPYVSGKLLHRRPKYVGDSSSASTLFVTCS